MKYQSYVNITILLIDSTLYMCGENGFVKFQGEEGIARVGGWWWCVSENFLNITGEPESL